MPRIRYHDRAGTVHDIDVPAGTTLMEGAVDNDIPGIVAECGGACACATCHAYIGEAWLAKLKPLEDMEDAMLDSARERRPNSRLTCQVEMSKDLDGIEVFVANNES